MTWEHQAVLLAQAIEGLAIRPHGIYVDGTFGCGGHTQSILKGLSNQGRLIAFDKDPAAIAAGEEQLRGDKRCTLIHGSFAQLKSWAEKLGVAGRVDGVLLDLGVSSAQLNTPERGFSFLKDGPLDMRMDTMQGTDAISFLNTVSEKELARILRAYGEERYANRIARAILKAQEQQPILRTKRLADIVAKANPAWEKTKHPATRSFQAIRIFINRELDDLRSCLEQALEVLAEGGRLVVISFHSLEDRIVKRFMKQAARGDDFPSDLPILAKDLHPKLRLIGKVIRPSAAEIAQNVRARSAILRIAEKLA